MTIPTRSVFAAIWPNSTQVFAEWPCDGSHGWKWSLASTKSKPACSAATACRTISFGSWPSVLSL